VKINKHFIIGGIYNLGASLVALFNGNWPQILLLWLQITVFRLTDMGDYQSLICFLIICGSV
jgi:hypothetical protein